MSPAHRGDGGITAAGRVAALLKGFRRSDGPLGVSALARRTGLPKSTVHRLAHQLADVGLLERSGDAFAPALLLFEIGQAAEQQRSLQEAARPHLSVLHDATGHNVTLSVLEGDDVVYLEIFRARHHPRLPQRTGGRWPAHGSWAGKAILAFTNASLDHDGKPLRALTDRTITDPAVLTKELERIRRQGVAYDRAESFPTIVGVAAPVLGADGHAVAAVAISGTAGRINVTRLDQAVRTTALAVSRSLAHRPR